jgi:hypothetical protein
MYNVVQCRTCMYNVVHVICKCCSVTQVTCGSHVQICCHILCIKVVTTLMQLGAYLMLSAAAMLYPMLVRIILACCATDRIRLWRGDRIDATANLYRVWRRPLTCSREGVQSAAANHKDVLYLYRHQYKHLMRNGSRLWKGSLSACHVPFYALHVSLVCHRMPQEMQAPGPRLTAASQMLAA